MKNIKNVLFIVLTVSVFISCSDEKAKKFINYDIRGAVKSIDTYVFEIKEENGDLARVASDNMKFSVKGGIILNNSFIEFHPDGQVHTLQLFDSERNISQDIEHKNNEIIHSSANGPMYSYIFDNIDFPNEIIMVGRNGDTISKTYLSYDTKANLIKEENHNRDGKLMESNEYFYENNLLIREKKMQLDNFVNVESASLVEINTYFKYNDNKDCIERVYKHPDYEMQSKYTYEYDSQENWVKRTEIIKDGATYELEREIIYF